MTITADIKAGERTMLTYLFARVLPVGLEECANLRYASGSIKCFLWRAADQAELRTDKLAMRLIAFPNEFQKW